MRSLVFATDATTRAAAALPLVSAIARSTAAKVDLFHQPASGERASGDAATALQAAEKSLRSAGVQTQTVQRVGSNAADAIRAYAREADASLIVVVGSAGGSLIDRIFGSTVYDLIDDSPCDLLVVAEDHAADHRAVRRSLVPINFAEESIRSLELATQFTEEGAEVVLLFNVPKEFPAFHGARGLGSDYKDEEQLEANWRSDLEAFWKRFGSAQHRPVFVRSEGSWHEEAEQAAQTYACDLVVAAETDGALRRGIAEKLAGRLTVCPVLVARTAGLGEPDDRTTV